MILKRITKLNFFRKILGYACYYYIIFCYKTSRWEKIYGEETRKEDLYNSNNIYAFWHGRIALMPYLSPVNRMMNILISSHRDGQIISNAMYKFNFDTIAGSSNKNPVAAIKKIIKKLKDSENVAITPDGSRGPARQINSNIIEIARISKSGIVPCSFSIKNPKIMNSWDSFMFPLPFSKGILIYGKKIQVDYNASQDEIDLAKKELNYELNRITDHADRLTKILE